MNLVGDLGEAGEVIVSDSVRQLALGKGFDFEPWATSEPREHEKQLA